MNVFRSLKPGRRYWITETGSGALDHNRPPHPDQFRAWAWSSLAHGAEAHLVFRWRTCLSGQEQELQGILEHSGSPRHRYQAVKKCFLELKHLWDEFKDLPLRKPQ
jgi:beta-galactosidase